MIRNWSATKQRLHPQSVAEIRRHSVLSGDRIWQCETSSGSRHKDTDHCKSLFPFAGRSVPVPCENGSAETTVAEGGRNPVAGLWGHTLGENWPPEPTSSYASVDFTSTWPHLRCDIGLQEREYKENCPCLAVSCTIIMVHKDTSSSYRSVNCIGLWSCLV